MESRFGKEISRFGKKDGILALCMFLFSTLLIVASITVRNMGFPMPWFVARIIEYIPVVTIIVIVLHNKQGLSYIGIHKEKLWPAIRLGLLFSLIPIIFRGLIPGFYGGFNRLSLGAIISAFAISLLFAAWEDILYAGFITPRLYGFIKSGWFAIPLGALLFAIMHVPAWVLNGGMHFGSWELLGLNGLQILRWCIGFTFYFAVFRKYYSIVPVILIHTINNFMWDLTSGAPEPFGMENWWIISNAARLLAAGTLFFHIYKSEKKEQQNSLTTRRNK